MSFKRAGLLFFMTALTHWRIINETINETGTINETTALVSRQAQH